MNTDYRVLKSVQVKTAPESQVAETAYIIRNEDIGQAAWSSEAIIQRLCPEFKIYAQANQVVECWPLEKYPLFLRIHENATSVRQYSKNLCPDFDALNLVEADPSGKGKRWCATLNLPEGNYTIHTEYNFEFEDFITNQTFLSMAIGTPVKNEDGTPAKNEDGTEKLSFDTKTLATSNQTSSISFTINEGDKIYLYNSSGGATSKDALKKLFDRYRIQIEEGEEATPFQPYFNFEYKISEVAYTKVGNYYELTNVFFGNPGVNYFSTNGGSITIFGRESINGVINRSTD